MYFLNSIDQTLKKMGEQRILSQFGGDRRWDTSASELRTLIRRGHTFLTRSGVQPGDRIALIADNSARWVAADLAIVAAGAISVPLYSRLSIRELAAVLEDCQPKCVIVEEPTYIEKFQGVWTARDRIITLRELFHAQASDMPWVSVSSAEPLTIIYTSGTTGEAKGVVLTRGNFDYMLPVLGQRISEILRQSDNDSPIFHCLPFCFAPSRLMLWTHLYLGHPLVLNGKLERFMEELRQADPPYFLAVPLLLQRMRKGIERELTARGGLTRWLYQQGKQAYRRMLKHTDSPIDRLRLGLSRRFVLAAVKRAMTPALRFIVCGSAPLSGATHSWFAMLGIPVYQGYGLTETTGVVTLERLDAYQPGCVGEAIDGCEVRLSVAGELICRGPNVFAGYWRRPAATAEVLRNGWLHTGDLADVDAAGNWRIHGRLKHTLVPLSGHNIQPEPLEQQLIEFCNGIEQAMVVGHGRRFLGAIFTGTAPCWTSAHTGGCVSVPVGSMAINSSAPITAGAIPATVSVKIPPCPRCGLVLDISRSPKGTTGCGSRRGATKPSSRICLSQVFISPVPWSIDSTHRWSWSSISSPRSNTRRPVTPFSATPHPSRPRPKRVLTSVIRNASACYPSHPRGRYPG
jgi:long-chain acyl-CoA synthetase